MISFHRSGFGKWLHAAAAVSLISSLAAREEQLLNNHYLFTLGDQPGAEKPGFDDSKWAPASVPHSFSTPYWGDNRFYVGYGWYRREVTIPQSWKGKRVFLDFEGVFQECELYVNGKFVGKHRGGYTGFEFDITDFVKPGKNLVAVRVNNMWNAVLPPRAGEHVFSGGIYRDVKLVAKDPLHVAWFGTFVTTPQVSDDAATVRVATELKNDAKAAVKGSLKTTLLDPEGKKVATMSMPIEMKAGETKEWVQDFAPLKSPKLWHPDSPRLYKAVTEVVRDGKVCDTFETPFGIRWFEFTKDKGFFLNGKPYYIIGANVHQDRAGWGDAAVNSDFDRDVKMIKDSGMNFIRGSHYPHDPAFTAACDRHGVLFWSEGVFWGIGGFKKDGYWDCSAYPPAEKDQAEFEENLKAALRDMIRVHRNHPSVVTWSMGNEIFFTEGSVRQKAKDCTQRLVEYSRQLDPSRPAAVGGVQRQGFDKIGDLAGYNGDGANEMHPTLPNLVAEYGSVVSNRPGQYASNRGYVEGKRFPWRSGEVLWCGFHHGSIAGSMGRMGFIDYFRLPLRSWYWYRNELRQIAPPEWPEKGIPAALSLTADRTTIATDGTDDSHLTIMVTDAQGKPIDATPEVTLTVVSGPGIFPTGKSITFKPNAEDIPIIEGKAAIEFRSYYAGQSRIKAESPGLKPAEVVIRCTGAEPFVEGKSKEWMPVAGKPTDPKSAAQFVECGHTRPAIASVNSEQAKFANDGDSGTAWAFACGDSGTEWWRLDMENFYGLQSVEIGGKLPEDVSFEVTADEGRTWTALPAPVKTASGLKVACDPGKVHGRFLRMTVKGKPGEKYEVRDLKVTGRTSRD